MKDYKKARKEVSELLGIELKDLTYILYKEKPDTMYRTFKIPKRNGEFRVIHAQKDNLKLIQRKLSDKLAEIHQEYIINNEIKANISHGFQKGRSISTNALVHKNKRYVLNIDILNFFPSFNFGRVQGYFYKSREFNFSKETSTIIAQLACYKGKLPQGAPSSPIISNLIFNIVDLRILSLVKKYKLNYTRYADDMSFSTNNKKFKVDYIDFIEELTELIQKNGFEINQDKTRLEYYSSRQEVTGLTVNDKLNANRYFINETRAMVNQLFKKNSFYIDGKDGSINQLEGRLSFINQLDILNNKLESRIKNSRSRKKFFSGLNAREKQYQYFLFYKYFFRPSKPTIVTEGKTDVLHIKSALMKYYDKFPKLIEKNKDGKFEFKIYFLNKTNRLDYFLGISKDGADTMKNIWNFYTGKNNCDNIYEHIKSKAQNKSLNDINPVILLFDNEQRSDRPLKKFLNHTNNLLNDKEVSKNLTANLFLQTIPLIKDVEECEIEDLYTKEVLEKTINGKKYSKNAESDPKKYFGKHILSIYVMKNYNNIDFSGFFELLKSIDSLI